MARGIPAHPDKERFAKEMATLGTLPKYYGKVVEAQFPHIDIKKLHAMVAGRTVYWEGFYALKAIAKPVAVTA